MAENERSSSSEWVCPKPMLAYAKPPEIEIDRFGALGWAAEPKVDGIRITLRRKNGEVQAWTRPGPGRPNGLMRALPQQVVDAVCRLPNGVYDGELAVAGMASWDAVSDATEAEKTFFVFDVLEMLGESVVRYSWTLRRQILEMAVSEAAGDRLVLVPTVPATDEEYSRQLDAGGEGLMLKQPDSVYRPGARTKQWLKVKPTERAPLTIIGFEPAIRGPHATLVLTDADENEITVSTPTPILNMADRNPQSVLNRVVTVKYQMRTAPSQRCPTGSYRHPRLDTEKTLIDWRSK